MLIKKFPSLNKLKKTLSLINNLVFLFALLILTFSVKAVCSEKDYKQWFTGTLISPTPVTMDPKHPSFEFLLFARDLYGVYNKNGEVDKIPSILSVGSFVDLLVGLNKVLGFEILASASSNFCEGQNFTGINDAIFRFGYQISNDKDNSWIPDLRIVFQETFPTGKFQRLDPKKRGTDLIGQGSFQSGAHLAFQKKMYQSGEHTFRMRGSLGYFLSSAVEVHGFNLYGGSKETHGVVLPGDFFIGYLAGEYSITRTMAFALEINYINGDRGFFSNKNPSIIDQSVQVPSYTQFSIAPEFQKTFTENTGLVLGTWFTVAGKDTAAFTVFFLALVHTF